MRVSRMFIAVAAAYAVMAVLGMMLFFGLVMILGRERLFEPGTYRSATIVNVAAVVISIVLAVIGGVLCARIGRSRGSVVLLAVLVFAFGVVSAVGNLKRPDPGPRPADVSIAEAMSHAKEPVWFSIANPCIGVVGVLVGARLTNRATPPKT